MASAIWNEKENRWVLRISINGHIRKFTSTQKGQGGKREVLRRYREYTEGRGATPAIVSDVWAEFLNQVIDRNGKTDAFYNLDKYGRNYILPKIGKMIIQNVTIFDLQEIISKAKPVSGRSDQLSHKTLSNLRASIMQFVKFSISAGYMEPLRGELFIPKTAPKNEKVISGLKRVSKPGLRIYAGADELPRVLKGLGIAIISTSKGIMTDKKAREEHIGGEVLAFVW